VWQRAEFAGICFLDPPETIATAFAKLMSL